MKQQIAFTIDSPGLAWPPLHQRLDAHMKSGDALLFLISPFIGLDALKRFIQSASAVNKNIKVVVRWRPEDIRSGVSDLAIFPYLSEKGIPLYVNQDIHLKLYVFESNMAFSTSGNLTLRGLGYSEKKNIEVGSFVQLTTEDWSNIYQLINASKQVDEGIYQRFKHYAESYPRAVEPSIPLLDLLGAPKNFTISSLPAVENPLKLIDYYFTPHTTKYPAEEIRRAAHDLVTFGIQSPPNRAAMEQQLSDSFRNTPFVVKFTHFLKREKSLRFGAVNDWIHNECEDVPLPYKWEIKENTRIFYNWLQYFLKEITWDRPNYSQVIYWQEK